MDVIFIRLVFVIIVGVICFVIRPFNLPSNYDAAVGLGIGCAIVVFEWRLRIMSLKRLIGAAIGSVLGIIGAYLFALVIRNSIPPSPTQSFLQIMVMLIMAYVGLAVGSNKGDLLNLAALGGIFGGEKQSCIFVRTSISRPRRHKPPRPASAHPPADGPRDRAWL